MLGYNRRNSLCQSTCTFVRLQVYQRLHKLNVTVSHSTLGRLLIALGEQLKSVFAETPGRVHPTFKTHSTLSSPKI